MLYREIIAGYSQIHTKHINTLCGQNVELLNVKPGGTYSDHWALVSVVSTTQQISSCTPDHITSAFPAARGNCDTRTPDKNIMKSFTSATLPPSTANHIMGNTVLRACSKHER